MSNPGAMIALAAKQETSAYLKVNASDAKGAAVCYEEAAEALTGALVAVLCARASTALELDDAPGAVSASCRAAEIDGRSASAWYWVGMAQMRSSNKAEAVAAFKKAAALETSSSKKAQYVDWITKASALEKVNGEAEKGAHDVVEVDVTEPTLASATYNISARSRGAAAAGAELGTAASASMAAAETIPQGPPPPRMEWYQSGSTVCIDLYAKQVDVAASAVEFSEKWLCARLVRPGKEDYVFERDLFGPVVVEESKWSASKFKVEIKLKKARGAENWRSLSVSGEDRSAGELAKIAEESRRKAVAEKQKNLASIVDAELKEAESKDPMTLFKTLYADADEDAQRAMMKSYQESGGKVLSTNWEDVGGRKVEYKEEE